jgi:hypothetical protein
VAVEKVFKDDLSGEFIRKEDVRVIRVGMLDDRLEAYERLDIGPLSFRKSIAELIEAAEDKRRENAIHGTTPIAEDDDGDTAPA